MGSSEIGARLRELREVRGISQADLGVVLHVDRTTVNNWERGVRDLKTEYTVKLADYYRTTCDYILRGVQSENVTVNKDLKLSDKAIDFLKSFDLGGIVSFLLEHADTGVFGALEKYYKSDFEAVWTEDLVKIVSSEPVDIAVSLNARESVVVRNKNDSGHLHTFSVKHLPEIYFLLAQDTLRKLKAEYVKTISSQKE